MAVAIPTGELIQPGLNAPEHTDTLHSSVAGSLQQATGTPVEPDGTRPDGEKLIDPVAMLPESDTSWGDAWNRWIKGAAGSIKSAIPERLLRRRLQEQHPDQQVVAIEE